MYRHVLSATPRLLFFTTHSVSHTCGCRATPQPHLSYQLTATLIWQGSPSNQASRAASSNVRTLSIRDLTGCHARRRQALVCGNVSNTPIPLCTVPECGEKAESHGNIYREDPQKPITLCDALSSSRRGYRQRLSIFRERHPVTREEGAGRKRSRRKIW